jgi:ATP-dependent protease HslVU (ClpYQ) peptidase subunit
MIVRLKRALYGCVESARMWYDHISTAISNLGYVKNRHDMCVFNRIEKDQSQSTLLFHVDDVFITATSENHIDTIIAEIQQLYPNLSVHRGSILNYIGMVFDFRSPGKCKITMDGYVDDLLSFSEEIQGTAKSPANNDLFKVDENAIKLDSNNKEYFHSLTAKLLYLAKRVRPDILTAVSVLVKRVTKPTVDDMAKLERVVRYIRGTQHLGIVLQADINLSVYGYIDASYGVHADLKSHSGSVIGIGKGPIYAKSSTQKLNTKSSSEAELVALSDNTAQVIWVRNFLVDQGYNIDPATIYQDNQSTIAMVKNGKSNSTRTRHIAIRFYFVTDRVASKEIKIEYMRTGDMIADILTKPLQGALFNRLRNLLLNWE